MPLPIHIELKPSPLLLAGALLLLCGAGCTLVLSPLAPLWRLATLAALCITGAAAVQGLLHGRTGRALFRLEWVGGPHWVLEDGRGRRRAARLAPASRRLGRVSLLVFQRGVFGRHDRPWVVVLPNMVSDASAARRLRARLTLEGDTMRATDVA
jgi:hypothetical protein